MNMKAEINKIKEESRKPENNTFLILDSYERKRIGRVDICGFR
jgi:hypothetical protein